MTSIITALTLLVGGMSMTALENSVVSIEAERRDERSQLFATSSSVFATGFLLAGTEHVITACHVISGAQKITIRDKVGRSCTWPDDEQVSIITMDPDLDLAVIEWIGREPGGLSLSTEAPIVGSAVHILSHPMYLEWSHDLGSVSRVGQKVPREHYADFPEFSAPLIQFTGLTTPGSSGGVLVNPVNTEVVGLIVGGFDQGRINVGFAIPSQVIGKALGSATNASQARAGTVPSTERMEFLFSNFPGRETHPRSTLGKWIAIGAVKDQWSDLIPTHLYGVSGSVRSKLSRRLQLSPYAVVAAGRSSVQGSNTPFVALIDSQHLIIQSALDLGMVVYDFGVVSVSGWSGIGGRLEVLERTWDYESPLLNDESEDLAKFWPIVDWVLEGAIPVDSGLSFYFQWRGWKEIGGSYDGAIVQAGLLVRGRGK